MFPFRPHTPRLAAIWIAASALALLSPATPAGVSPNIVISQVYGGGGNSGAPYTHDFIELFNRGNTAASLAGWSLQYASATGTGNFGANSGQITELPAVTLQPGQYFLVQQAGGAAGAPLPTADATDTTPINMSATAGKVALASITTTLGCNGGSTPCSAGQLATIVDLVGYGGANFFEGTAAAPALSNTTAAFRASDGCTDTDANAADFAANTPAPRNSTAPVNVCDGPPAVPSISIDDRSTNEGDAGITLVSFTVSLSSPAPEGGVSFDISTADGSATAGSDYLSKALTAQIIEAGSTSYRFEVEITGDTAIEPDETFIVSVTNVAGALAGDTEGLATIRNDDYLATTIPAIQGDGLLTPLAGQPVTTQGIVTGVKVNGFFMQSVYAADANPNTSEGLFVFTSTAPGVVPGDLVAVRGTAGEFFELTQIDSRQPDQVVVLSSGHALPAPVVLTTSILDRKGHPTQLERFEGMRLQGTLTSVAPANQFGEIYAVLQGVKRPHREPGIEAGLPIPPDPESGMVDCCVAVWDRNPERIMVDTDGLSGSTAAWVSSKVSFLVTGPLDFTFGDYKILPATPLVPSANMSAVPVAAAGRGEFTVASYNIENFRGIDPQKRKAALNIRDVMRAPDVIGVVEVSSLSALQALASQVNADAAAAGETDPQYVAELIPFGTGSQQVGFLVKSSRVQVTRVTQERASDTYINPLTGRAETLHDRPPLVLDAVVDPHGASPARVLVVVNHLRSFIGIESVDGEGVRVRAKRKAQAEAIAELLQSLQSANPATPVIAVGDYNAYEFSDGYTDPISVIRGRPTAGDQIVVAGSADMVNPDFVNLTDSLPPDERYSFIFEGTPQALDHILVNRVAYGWVQRYAVARSNADFPDALGAGLSGDATRPEAHSDHDAPVAYFRIPGKPAGQR